MRLMFTYDSYFKAFNFHFKLCLSLIKNYRNYLNNSVALIHSDAIKEPIPLYLHSDNENSLRTIISSMKVIDDFVTEDEEKCLIEEIEPFIKRLRYEESHWDDAIHKYRECERLKWTQKNNAIIDRIRMTAFPSHVNQIKHVHVLDLAKDGYIKPHIDSVRFCGDTIAGLSLLSSSVMRLTAEDNKQFIVDMLLNRRSLYILSGDTRYKFKHEILRNENSIFKGETVEKDRRISVICRNEPNDDQS